VLLAVLLCNLPSLVIDIFYQLLASFVNVRLGRKRWSGMWRKLFD